MFYIQKFMDKLCSRLDLVKVKQIISKCEHVIKKENVTLTSQESPCVLIIIPEGLRRFFMVE